MLDHILITKKEMHWVGRSNLGNRRAGGKERGPFFRLLVNERVRISSIKANERFGKSVIAFYERS